MRFRNVRPVCVWVITALALCALWPAWARNAPQGVSEDVRTFIRHLHFGKARSAGSLTIIPLLCPDRAAAMQTLSEALRAQTVTIKEIGEGRVNQLEIENHGKLPVYVMAGQILVGAKQNRVLQHDLLLRPSSGPVQVEAFCVQHGRWSEQDGSAQFKRSDNVSNPAVRQAGAVEKSQTQVWASVDKTRTASYGVFAGNGGTPMQVEATGDLNAVYESDAARKTLDAAERTFRNLPAEEPDMHGAMVCVDGRVVATDVFGDRAVLERLWKPLLASYLLDGVRKDRSDMVLSRDHAEAFLALALKSDIHRIATPGDGILVEIVSPDAVQGDALVHDGRPIHLDLFPGQRHKHETDAINEPAIQRNR